MKEPLRLLLVEDSEDDALFLLRELRRASGYEIVSERVDTPEAFVAALNGGSWEVVVSDYFVPGFGALQALALLKKKGLDLPFIVVSGQLGEETAVEVMRAGARDYVMKHNLARLGPAIERELGEARARQGRAKQLEGFIEELRFNERVLRESEERFRATFEQAAVGMAHVDLDGRWTQVNRKLCDIVGYTREELLEMTFQDITHPDDLDKDLERVRRMLDGEMETYSMEKRYFHKSGFAVWVNLTVSLVHELSGEPKHFISVVEDITERKRIEEELRLRDRAVAASSDGIIISDPNQPDNPIVYVNPAFERITGYTAEEAIGRNCRFLQGYDREQPFLDELHGAVREGRYSTALLRNYRKDGTLFWNELSISPIHDENGHLTHFIGVQNDVTRRKLAEQHRESRYAVSRILAESDDLDEAAPKLLEAIGAELGWEVSLLWIVDRRTGVLCCGQTWRASSAEATEFEAASRKITPSPGHGLPGRVWESGKPLWIPDVLQETNFLRAESAAREGLHGALAFPIQDKGRVLGVVEFFSHKILAPDEDLLQTVAIIGDQIGQFIERKRGEEALRESEERYRVVAETASDAIFMIDEESRILFVNSAAEEIFGYSSEEMLGEPLTMLMPERLRDRHRDGLQWYFDTNELGLEALQLSGLHKSGRELSLEVSFGGFVKEDTRFFTGFVRDITERQQIAAALHQSEELYRTVVEQAAENIFLFDAETKHILEANATLHRSLGYSAEEIRGMTLYDIVAHDRESVDQNLRLIVEEGRFVVGERKYRRKDGSTADVEVSASAILYGGRKAICVTAHDVTERKQMEDDLRRSLGVLLALHEAGRILTSSLDLEEIGTRLLEVIKRVSSLTTAVISLPDESQELRIWRAVGLENLWSRARYSPEVQAPLRAVLETGDHRLFRLKRPEENGGALVGLCLPLRIQDRPMGLLEVYGSEELLEENALEILGSMSNQAASALENAQLYGELAEREKQLHDLVGKLLKAQEEERRRIAYEVHDGLTQVATATHQRLEAFARRHPQTSERSGKDLDRILGLARRTVGEARRVVSDLRPVALDDFGLVVALQGEIEELRDDGWRVDYEQNLGDERIPAAVETALYRVGQEALTNARKHAQARRARLEILRREDEVVLEVRDWGHGFDPSALSAGSGPGERVGISGMRERIGMLGGELEICSRPGEGVRITARVPLSMDEPNAS